MSFNVVKFMILVIESRILSCFRITEARTLSFQLWCSKGTLINWLWYFWILWLGIKNQKIYFKLILHKKIFLTLSDCGPNMGRPWSGFSPIVVRSPFDLGQTMVRSWSDHGLAETEIEFGDECLLNNLKSSSTSRDIVI